MRTLRAPFMDYGNKINYSFSRLLSQDGGHVALRRVSARTGLKISCFFKRRLNALFAMRWRRTCLSYFEVSPKALRLWTLTRLLQRHNKCYYCRGQTTGVLTNQARGNRARVLLEPPGNWSTS